MPFLVGRVDCRVTYVLIHAHVYSTKYACISDMVGAKELESKLWSPSFHRSDSLTVGGQKMLGLQKMVS